ncbi:Zinc transporter ZIP9 [Toxocara canis]|uniref:Zinc transporter ZIP9 n=1 Tax=Toxocara canis TaxID=6265 RepID=A0A0B2VN91_TOXCA|nr:Zinc transporter ZIP9 [Toxocara canis]
MTTATEDCETEDLQTWDVPISKGVKKRLSLERPAMDGVYLLATLSAAMFIGSYLAGSIPLAFTLSQNRTRLFSIFGAGLLVGTALSVIIPEGVESLYSAQAELHKAAYHKGEAGALILEENAADRVVPPRVIPHDAELNKNLNTAVGDDTKRSKRSDRLVAPQRNLQEILPRVGKVPPEQIEEEKRAVEPAHEGAHEHERALGHEAMHENSIHKSIGLSLIVGFIIMLIIDQATRSATFKAGERPRFKMTATIGLVVHAAADGVALGSASATNRTDVQFIVFLAIMLHKAPAAFGLVSFLLVEGLERVRVRRHLLVFSLAAPVTALLTFYAIVAVGSESLSSGLSIGVLMLFSAGTFLYVATVHVLPELVRFRFPPFFHLL